MLLTKGNKFSLFTRYKLFECKRCNQVISRYNIIVGNCNYKIDLKIQNKQDYSIAI